MVWRLDCKGQEWRQGELLGGFAKVWVRDDGGFVQDEAGKGGVKGADLLHEENE